MNASKSDILDAIPSRAPSEDWHILVARGNERWREGRHWKEYVPPAKAASGARFASILPFLGAAGALMVFVVGPMLWGYLDIGERLAAIPLPTAIDSTIMPIPIDPAQFRAT